MQPLQPEELTTLLLALAVLLGTARCLGEMAQRFRQPAVLGEILAGVLLGPTVLGKLAPCWQSFLFPGKGAQAVALHGISTLAIVLYLLVAGMEVDLSTVWRQGQVALKVGVTGIVVPFFIGVASAWLAPTMVGRAPDTDGLIFALFFGTALSISALPVITKTMRDLNLYRTDLGMIVVSAAMFDDIIGWTIFAVILGMMDSAPHHGPRPAETIALTLMYAGGMLTVGRWLIHRVLPYLLAYTHSTGGVLGFALTMAFLGAAFTESIGIHAIFGSFIVGIAIGDSSHLREHTRVVVDQFVSFIFAPVFFATIGLTVNFWEHFDPWLTLIVLVIACAGKLLGAALGARWSGLSTRDRWAIGFAMNARGAMEIILGLLALQAGVIEPPLFVSLVLMAIVTSLMGGPLIRTTLRHRLPRGLVSYLSPQFFARDLKGTTRREAIHELVSLCAASEKLDVGVAESVIWAREEAVATGIGNGIAIPHARIRGLSAPVVVVGVSQAGVDFDSPDGRPAHVVFLILTPAEQPELQLDLASEIAAIFRESTALDRVLHARTFTEVLAALKTSA